MKNKLEVCIATMFFSGLIPGPGGTWGSIVAWLIILLVGYCTNTQTMQLLWCGALFYLSLFAGMLTIPKTIEALNQKEKKDKKSETGDFNAINIDEAHGVVIACIPVFCYQPEHWVIWTMIAVVFFRIFDILKPLGITRIEKMSNKRTGLIWKAWIIMVDDSVAGIYAAITTLIALEIYPIFLQ